MTPPEWTAGECHVRAKVYAEGAVLCHASESLSRAQGGDLEIVHRRDAGCRRQNPVLVRLSGDEVEGLRRIEEARERRGLVRRTAFCHCTVDCGQPPSRQEVLQARHEKAQRALERAQTRYSDALAQYEWEVEEAVAVGYFSQAYHEAKTKASEAQRKMDYAHNAVAAARYALSAPTLEWDEMGGEPTTEGDQMMDGNDEDSEVDRDGR